MLGLIAKRMFQLIDVLFVGCLPFLLIGLVLGIFSASSGVQFPTLLWGINTSIMGLALILLAFHCVVYLIGHAYSTKGAEDALVVNGVVLGVLAVVLFGCMSTNQQMSLAPTTGFLQFVILSAVIILALVEAHIKDNVSLEQPTVTAIAITQEKEEE